MKNLWLDTRQHQTTALHVPMLSHAYYVVVTAITEALSYTSLRNELPAHSLVLLNTFMKTQVEKEKKNLNPNISHTSCAVHIPLSPGGESLFSSCTQRAHSVKAHLNVESLPDLTRRRAGATQSQGKVMAVSMQMAPCTGKVTDTTLCYIIRAEEAT